MFLSHTAYVKQVIDVLTSFSNDNYIRDHNLLHKVI